MSEGPKLYVNKPKKAHVKQIQEQLQSKAMDSQSSSTSSSSSSVSSSSSSIGGGYGGASKPPEVPRESFARRYKFLWPLLLTVNLAVGAYLFMRTNKKEVTSEDETTTNTTSSSSTSSPIPTTAVVTQTISTSLPVVQPPTPKVLEPVPEQQQRELFKWMLEEKRKIKTNDPQEKKRIDEEKAILKQFIRAKSIPSI